MTQPFVIATTRVGAFTLFDDTGLLYPVVAVALADVEEDMLVVGTSSANRFLFIDQTGAQVDGVGQPAGGATGPNLFTVPRALNTLLVSATGGSQVLAVAQSP